MSLAATAPASRAATQADAATSRAAPEPIAMGYFKAPHGNVGDDLNPWLLPKLLPDVTFGDGDRALLAIGSILTDRTWDGFAAKLVMGSGARSAERMPVLDASWDVRFVRGPRTAALMPGVPYIADPAVLIARFAEPAGRRRGIGIVPYFRAGRRTWRLLAATLGARIIPPTLDVETFAAEVGRCERVFCEAMHGAIIADALRVKWCPISFLNRPIEGPTHVFKWSDWLESMGRAFDPLVLPTSWMDKSGLPRRVAQGRALATAARRLRAALADDRFELTDTALLRDKVEALSGAFDALNRELR